MRGIVCLVALSLVSLVMLVSLVIGVALVVITSLVGVVWVKVASPDFYGFLPSAFILLFINLNCHGNILREDIWPICLIELVLDFILESSVVDFYECVVVLFSL
jgi:uncharacterized membrane protein YccC